MRPDHSILIEQLQRSTKEVLPGTTSTLLPAAAVDAAAGAVAVALLPLSIDGQAHSLVLQARSALLEQAFWRMMGRAATDRELPAMAGEVAAELLNQVGGHLAGRMGELGAEVDLATPRVLTPGPAAPGPAGGPAIAWCCGGVYSLLFLETGGVP